MKNVLLFTIIAIAGVFAAHYAHGALVFSQVIHGEALCARCQLKEPGKCQIVIRTVESGTNVLYYATPDRVADKFQPKACQGAVKVWAKGTVRERDGKNQITLKLIELESGDKRKQSTP
jgi:hypothetical protein